MTAAYRTSQHLENTRMLHNLRKNVDDFLAAGPTENLQPLLTRLLDGREVIQIP